MLLHHEGAAADTGVAQIVSRPDEDLQIFSFDLGNIRLLDTILVYEDLDSGKFYAPLSDIADALEFPIEVNGGNSGAKGWFINEQRAFGLNLDQATALVNGREYALATNEIERHEDGIYVSLELLEKWFPVTLDVDFSELRLVVHSLEPLPIEIRREREKKREEISKAKGQHVKQYPLGEVRAPYFTMPIVNVNAQAIYDNAPDAQGRIIKSSTALASAVVAGQDFNLSINDSTNNGQGPDIRTHIGLKDLGGNLFGIGGTEYRLGDIYSTTLPYISSSSSGRGAYFTTFADGGSDSAQSGTTRLRGELPVGYQVDVMRNGQLLAFQEEPDSNGEYIFDLDVLPGLNVFELVFYGPQGQKETREERLFVPLNPARKGKLDFRANILEQNRNLITNHNDNSSDLDANKYRATLEAQYGLSDLSSVYAALSDVTIDGKRQRYGALRLSRSFKSVRTDWTYAKSFSSGSVLGVRFQTIFRGISWQAEHSSYRNGFVSEQTESAEIADPLKHDTELRVSGPAPFLNNVPFTLNLRRLSNVSGAERVSWNLNATKNISKIRVRSEVSQVFEEDEERETDLSFQVSSRINKLNLRGGANFNIEPEYNLRNISLLADWRFSPKATMRIGAERSGIDEDVVHSLTLGGSYKFDPAILGLNIRYNDENELTAILSTSFSIGRDPLQNRVFVSHERLAGTAMMAPRVYYDENNNGTYDHNDHPLPDIKFEGQGIDRFAQTGSDGYALLQGLDSYERSTLRINEASLPDPFLIPAGDPKDYILRAGQVVRRDLPVILVGEIDGEAVIADRGRKSAAQSFIVNAQNVKNTEKTYQAKTEYDGFVWFQKVPMGQYKIHLDQAQLDELGYCNNQMRTASLNSEEPATSVRPFVIWPKLNDHVMVILGRGNTDKLKQRWEALSKTMQQLFFDMGEYPSSYILTQAEEEKAALTLYNLEVSTAKDVCRALKKEGEFCEIWKMKPSYCPADFVAIPQISRESKVADISVSEEGITEDMLRDLTEQDIIDAIDN